ncbi:MAG: hypothetical protein IJN63_06875 [Clostridia bacterium]|nr:hypothetical protein [Clostridia bacterium]
MHYVYDVTNNVTPVYSGMTAKWTAAMSANAYSLVKTQGMVPCALLVTILIEVVKLWQV